MLSSSQIEQKLRDKAEEFRQAYMKRDYARAKNIFDTAERVAVFAELDADVMHELFGNDPDENIQPLFNPEYARKCYLEIAVKGNGGFEKAKYKTVKEVKANE